MGDYGAADIAFLVLGGIFGTGSFTILTLGLYAIRSRHRAQQTYVLVDAVVVSHRLIESNGDGWYEPRVEYEFVVDGVTHTSSHVWAGPNDSYAVSLKNANEVLDRFPIGQHVQSFYDPNDPEQAFLLRTPPASGVFGGYFIPFSCLVVIVVLFSIAWHIDVLWELIAAHALFVAAAFGWFLCVARKDEA